MRNTWEAKCLAGLWGLDAPLPPSHASRTQARIEDSSRSRAIQHCLASLSPLQPHHIQRRRGPGLHSTPPRRSKSTKHKRWKRVRFKSLARLVASRCKPDHHGREPPRHSPRPPLSVGTQRPQPYPRASSASSWHSHKEEGAASRSNSEVGRMRTGRVTHSHIKERLTT